MVFHESFITINLTDEDEILQKCVGHVEFDPSSEHDFDLGARVTRFFTNSARSVPKSDHSTLALLMLVLEKISILSASITYSTSSLSPESVGDNSKFWLHYINASALAPSLALVV